MVTMTPSSRRRFLAKSGWGRRHAGDRIVAGRHRICARRPRCRACAHPAAARARRFRSPGSWRLSRTSREGGLHRRLSAGIATGRCERLPQRRRARGQGDRACQSSAIRAAISSPATTGWTAWDRSHSGRRCSSGRGTRSRRTSSAPTSSSTGAGWSGTEPLLGMNFGTGICGDGRRLRRVLQLRARHQVERSASLARLREAAQRALLVPRQRDGRAVADRADAGARVRAQGARCGAADARHRRQCCS